jgi:glycogen debranching enzyme
MQQLETDAGYRSGIPVTPEVDDYHMNIWTHEQALLHAAARKHKLPEAQDITSRITAFIFPKEGIFHELIDPDAYDPQGNPKQLWAMAAYLYFQNPEQALL